MLDKGTKKRLAQRISKRMSSKVSVEQREEIVRRYADNESAASIAEDLGISLVTVYKWVNRAAEADR